MRVTKVRSSREVDLNINRYRIDWNKKCRSKFQDQVKAWLRTFWWKHVCLEEVTLPGSRLKCDLINITKRIIIEMNGEQHDTFNPHFHRKNRQHFQDQIIRDEHKRDWADKNGFYMIEIYEKDLPLSVEFFKEKFDVEIS